MARISARESEGALAGRAIAAPVHGVQSRPFRYVPGFVYILVLFIARKLIFPDPRAILVLWNGYHLSWVEVLLVGAAMMAIGRAAKGLASRPGLSFVVVPSRPTILPSRPVGNESSVVFGVGILPECAPPACCRLMRLKAFPVCLSHASSSQRCGELPGLAFPIGIGSQARSFLPPSTSPAEKKKPAPYGLNACLTAWFLVLRTTSWIKGKCPASGSWSGSLLKTGSGRSVPPKSVGTSTPRRDGHRECCHAS